MEPVMTMMRFYLPNFLRDQWYSQRRRVAKGPIELATTSCGISAWPNKGTSERLIPTCNGIAPKGNSSTQCCAANFNTAAGQSKKASGWLTGAKPMSQTICKPTRSETVNALHRPDGLVEILP